MGAPNVFFDKTKGIKGIYRVWYSGQSSDCISHQIGYAESEDGIHWVKHAANPVLRLDAIKGNGGFWPKVLFDEGTGAFEMWYNFRCVLAHNYATSLDGITWCKCPSNPLRVDGEFMAASTGPVLWDVNRYHMVYNREDELSLGYATSPRTLPRASFTLAPETGFAPVEVTVDAGRSATPPGSSVTTYSWDFGDGETVAGGSDEVKQVKHTYSRAGEYLLKLTVTDTAENAGSVARKVLVDFPCGAVDPWTSKDIGQPSGAGCARIDGDCVEVLAAVGYVDARADVLHFVHQKVSGDFCLTAQVSAWNPDIRGANIGLMARQSLEPGSAEVSVVLQLLKVGIGVQRLSRTDTDADTTSVTGGLSGPGSWLRLERRGKEFIGLSSLDGVCWSEPAPVPATAMTPEIEVGIVATESRGPDGRDFAVARVCELKLVKKCQRETSFRRGDANSDGAIDLSDAIFTLSYLFLAGPASECLKSADADDSGILDITDAVFLLSYFFFAEPPPAEPFPDCGADRTEDQLSCESQASCC